MSKAEYLANLGTTWAVATNYFCRRSNERIVISGNAATITADVVETFTIRGNTMRTRTSETAPLELVDGAARVTRMAGNASM